MSFVQLFFFSNSKAQKKNQIHEKQQSINNIEMIRKEEIILQPQWQKNTFECECLITIPSYLRNKKLWIGLYSVCTQDDTQYLSYKYLKPNQSSVRFKDLVNGLFEFRLFEDQSSLFIGNKYHKLTTSAIFRIGHDFHLSHSFDDSHHSQITVTYDHMIEQNDWIGLYSLTDSNTSIPLKKHFINVTQNKLTFNTESLTFDAVEGTSSLAQKQFHFRYFISTSVINSQPIPFAVSSPFVFPFPAVSARRVSLNYIKVHFINNHNNVWCGLFYQMEDSTALMTCKDVESNGYFSVRYHYAYGEQFMIKLYSHSGQLLASCSLSSSSSYP